MNQYINFAKQFICIYFLIHLALACTQSKEDQPNLPSLNGPAQQHFLFTRPEPDADLMARQRPRRTIKALLDHATHRIDIWAYGLDESSLLSSMQAAARRGVEVSLVLSPEKDYSAVLVPEFKVSKRNRSGLQHAKLILIDDKILIGGTGNFTLSGLLYNHNVYFYIFIDPTTGLAIRTCLAIECPGPIDLPAFGARLIFAPNGGHYIQNQLLQEILHARQNLNYMIFSHTDPLITASLLLRAREGLEIQGIYDDASNSGELNESSEVARLNKNLGLSPARLYLEGNRRVFQAQASDPFFHGGHLHHKTLVVDQAKVFTGSYNWSASARDRNLESFFSFQNVAVAALFLDEFDRIAARSVLLERTPFAPAQDRYFRQQSDQYCSNTLPANGEDLNIFQGRGPYFRVRHYKLIPQKFCINQKEYSNYSSGALRSKEYALPIPSIFDSGYQGLPGPGRLLFATDHLPCESSLCKPISLKAWYRDEGLLDIETGTWQPTHIRSWNRTGFSNTYRLQKLAAGFYHYPSQIHPGGDALFFLESENDKKTVYVACGKSGKELNANLETFRVYLQIKNGRPFACRTASP